MVANDSMSVPMVTMLPAVPATVGLHNSGSGSGSSGSSAALTVCLDPTEPLLELMLTVDGQGATFGRHFLRIGPGLQRKFSARIIAHAPSYRAGLHHVVQEWPSLFDAPGGSEIATEFSGLGSYGWDVEHINGSWAKAMGLVTNWDLGGTWMAYDGLFLPYTRDWTNLASGESGKPTRNVSAAMISAAYQHAQSQGLKTLSYFDIGNWGTAVSIANPEALPLDSDSDSNGSDPKQQRCGVRPNGLTAPCPDDSGSSGYLWEYLMAAAIKRSWSADRSWTDGLVHDWSNTVDMDPGDMFFQDLMVEQAAQHVERIPHFQGFGE